MSPDVVGGLYPANLLVDLLVEGPHVVFVGEHLALLQKERKHGLLNKALTVVGHAEKRQCLQKRKRRP